MERVIEIHDKKEGNFFLDLPDILPALLPDAHAWRWSISQWPELTSDERWDLNLPFIEREIERSARGLVLDFEELEQFAARVHQVIWGEFIAAEYEGRLPLRSASPAEVGRSAAAGLLAFDSSFWCLGGPHDFVERAATHFESVVESSASEWPALD